MCLAERWGLNSVAMHSPCTGDAGLAAQHYCYCPALPVCPAAVDRPMLVLVCNANLLQLPLLHLLLLLPLLLQLLLHTLGYQNSTTYLPR